MSVRIVVANSKGGVGKTFLAREISAEIARRGRYSVSLEDMDPQQSLAKWHTKGKQTLTQLNQPGTTFVVCDTPPRIESHALKDAIRSADIVLVPLTPGDIEETAQTLLVLEEAKKENVLIVRNRVKANTLSARQLETLITPGKMKMAKTTIGALEDFVQARVLNTTVVDLKPRSIAAEQIRALVQEIFDEFIEPPADATVKR